MLFPMLAACSITPDVEIQTSRFSEPSSVPPGTYRLLADEDQQQSLEYRTYAAQLEQELRAINLTRTSDSAAYGVRFALNSEPPEIEVRQDTFASSAYINRGFTPFRYATFENDLFNRPRLTSRLSTPHTATLQIVKLAQDSETPVFEGRATMLRENVPLAAASRCLFRALLNNFPGANGEVRTVVLPADSCISSPDAPLSQH